MDKQNKKPMSIVRWMIVTNLLSILGVGILLASVCGYFVYNLTNTDYQKIAKSSSMHIASMLDELDEGEYRYDESTNSLYKGDVLVTDTAFRTVQKEDSDMHHTIFWGDTRILSDVTDTNGQSVVGTVLSDASIKKEVEQEGIYSASNVTIYGKKYSVCYYPMQNGNEIVGMVFTGVVQEEANRQFIVAEIIFVVVALVLAFVISACIVTMIYKKAKEFGLNLSEASNIAEEKKASVTELGVLTKENMEQINQAIEQVTMAVTEQASHTEEIMGSMEEFASSIDIIMDQVQVTTNVAGGSISLIDELKGRLQTLEEVSESNSSEIIGISQQIKEDSDAVSNICKIIDVISDIAFQITILSFNASVEAARAGEYGKGFAVVAESIKDLSNKTKDSLDDITKIVQEVNDKMYATNQSSANLVSENDKVREALAQTKTQLNDVTDAFAQITQNLSSVMEQSCVITDSKNEVVQTVSSLAAASQENAAMSEEMKATSDEVIAATDHLIAEIERLQEVTGIIENVKILFSDNLN